MKKWIRSITAITLLFSGAQQAVCGDTSQALKNQPQTAVDFTSIEPSTGFTNLRGPWGEGVCPQTKDALTADLILKDMDVRAIWTQPDTIEGFFDDGTRETFHPTQNGKPNTDFQILANNMSAICGKYIKDYPQAVPMKVDPDTGKLVIDQGMLKVYLEINMGRLNKAMKPLANRAMALSKSPKAAGEMTLKEMEKIVKDPNLAKQIFEGVQKGSQPSNPSKEWYPPDADIDGMRTQAIADQAQQDDWKKQGIDPTTMPVEETQEQAAERKADQDMVRNWQEKLVGKKVDEAVKILKQEQQQRAALEANRNAAQVQRRSGQATATP